MTRPTIGRIGRPAAIILGAAALQMAPAAVGCPGVTTLVTRLARPIPPGGVLLTFDDGPHPEGTPAILDRLAARGIRAVFFVVGEQLSAQPDLGRRLAAEGHEIGVHGWDHRAEPCLLPTVSARGIRRTVEAVTGICGRPPRWYRPPYGVATVAALIAARRNGLSPVWWTRWGRDWSPRASPETIAAGLLGDRRSTRGGQVLLLHDSDRYGTPGSWRRTADALDRVIAVTRARGEVFVAPDALLPGPERRDPTVT